MATNVPAAPTSYAKEEYYKLPNDSAEHTRLERQSRALRTLLGRVHHAPKLPANAAILDVGCGTGTVSIGLALGNPTGTVQGLDLTTAGFRTHTAPPNLTFVKGDVMELAGKDQHLAWGSQDFVFSRLLVCGMRAWPEYVRTAARLLKPGGYLEMQDLAYRFLKGDFLDGDQEFPLEWVGRCSEVASAQGMDLCSGEHCKKWFEDAGLVDVQVHKYPWPNGEWAANRLGREETRQIGKEVSSAIRPLQYHLVAKILEDHAPKEEIERLQQECWDKSVEIDGVYRWYYATIGRKPEA